MIFPNGPGCLTSRPPGLRHIWLIARYRSAYPGIELRIRQAGSTELGRLLGERSVDVIFGAVADESTGFVSVPLARSRLAVVCSAGQALVGTAEVDLRDLSGSALVGYPLGWEVRTLSDRALRSGGVEPRYAFEVNDTRTLLNLVEIGLGVAVFPEAIAAPRGARLREIAISGRLDGPRRGACPGTVEPRRPSAVDDAS